MAETAQDPRRVPPGSDGWLIIALDDRSLVRADPVALRAVGLHAGQLPIELTSVLGPTDQALFEERILPIISAGAQWSGSLRLGASPSDARLIGVTIVPHNPPVASEPPQHASLLISAPDADRPIALADPLTGLPTRSVLFDRLDRALDRSRSSGASVGVLFLDLDGLKNINDRYGHEVGDTVLIEAAQRIILCLRGDDMVARFGGDEFVVLCESIAGAEAANELAKRIQGRLGAMRGEHAIPASIGIAIGRGDDGDAHELVRRADTAMYRAKARGGAQVATFDRDMQTRQHADQALRTQLLEAISSDGFGVAAQPIFALGTGAIIGVELFIRLREDAPVITSATELFRLAHEHSEAIDAAMLTRAVELATRWRATLGRDAPRLHVNISAQSLASLDFSLRVADVLARGRVAPSQIAVEISSHDLVAAGDRERDTIAALASIGTALVVDGYGSGSLNLVGVAQVSPAMVKIATRLSSARDSSSPHLLASLVRAISTLRIATCIKGIESDAVRNHAVSLGCFAGQGNALTPVRQVGRVDQQLRTTGRIGF